MVVPSTHHSSDKPFRILSLAGGGYLGLYTACVLAELEESAGEPLGRRFDLIAGTSVGGLLAIALAFEMPMWDLRELFLRQGAESTPESTPDGFTRMMQVEYLRYQALIREGGIKPE